MSSDWPPPPRGVRRKRQVTEEERSLWKAVNKDTVPLVQPTTIYSAEPKAKPDLAPNEMPPYVPQVFRPVGRPSKPSTQFVPKPDELGTLSAKTPGIDRSTARNLRKGGRAPDARIDLHGMTMERAHSALINFIQASRQKNLRCVLVITGKGEAFRRGSEPGDRSLKRDVPRWLNLPPLGNSIVGVFEAHQRHGGAGALYVYLKKSRG